MSHPVTYTGNRAAGHDTHRDRDIMVAVLRPIQLVAGAIVIVAAISHVIAQPQQAAEPERLLRQAEAKAKAGEYALAIELYKRADQLKPRAAISCFIGLAYVRSAAWAQAELAFDACRRRVSDADPAPPWLPKAQRELETKIERSNVPVVVFRVYSNDPDVSLLISGWPAGDRFAPRQLHLPAGRYWVDAVGSDGRSVRTEFDVTAANVEVDIDLNQSTKRSGDPHGPGASAATRPGTPTATDSPLVAHPPAVSSDRNRSRGAVGYALLGGGGLAVAAGAVGHILAARDRAAMETSSSAWDEHRTAFGRERIIAVSGYAVGAALVAAGTYWLLRSSDSERSVTVAPIVSSLTDGPMGLALEWSQ